MVALTRQSSDFPRAVTHCLPQLSDHHNHDHYRSGINQTVSSAVPPARFVEHCSGVNDDERENGDDVNVRPEGRESK